ncbi:MAG: IS110 family transposase [Bdellovibrionales bacterium]|nr:IS110 family transposase [Bdellovibrionales bacterium]
MNTITLGVDLAKNVFQLHGIDSTGKVTMQRKISRTKLLEFMVKLPPCLIGMEACGGSNYFARKFIEYGHTVKLMSPQFVKPYVKGNKNDCNDAEAICEAVTRPNMRFVSAKSIEQQDLQSLHRIRSNLIQSRTALVNQIRGLLAEYGIIISKQVQNLRNQLPEILTDDKNELSIIMRTEFDLLYQDLVNLDARISSYDIKLKEICNNNQDCQRILEIEGVGFITATAIIAAVGDPKSFKNGREFSAWLGLVPRQSSSGGKERLLGISKRGDKYVRTLLIHGARSVVCKIANKEDKRSIWIQKLKERRGMNKTCVAVANKNARIIWALLSKEEAYKKAS